MATTLLGVDRVREWSEESGESKHSNFDSSGNLIPLQMSKQSNLWFFWKCRRSRSWRCPRLNTCRWDYEQVENVFTNLLSWELFWGQKACHTSGLPFKASSYVVTFVTFSQSCHEEANIQTLKFWSAISSKVWCTGKCVSVGLGKPRLSGSGRGGGGFSNILNVRLGTNIDWE